MWDLQKLLTANVCSQLCTVKEVWWLFLQNVLFISSSKTSSNACVNYPKNSVFTTAGVLWFNGASGRVQKTDSPLFVIALFDVVVHMVNGTNSSIQKCDIFPDSLFYKLLFFISTGPDPLVLSTDIRLIWAFRHIDFSSGHRDPSDL